MPSDLTTFHDFASITESEELMIKKMAPFIRKVEAHYNDREKGTFLDTIPNYRSNIPIVVSVI